MNVKNFIKNQCKIDDLNFKEGVLSINLKNPLKLLIISKGGSFTPIICDFIDLHGEEQTVYFGCNDFNLLSIKESSIADIVVKNCSNEEYKKECERLEEVFV